MLALHGTGSVMGGNGMNIPPDILSRIIFNCSAGAQPCWHYLSGTTRTGAQVRRPIGYSRAALRRLSRSMAAAPVCAVAYTPRDFARWSGDGNAGIVATPLRRPGKPPREFCHHQFFCRRKRRRFIVLFRRQWSLARPAGATSLLWALSSMRRALPRATICVCCLCQPAVSTSGQARHQCGDAGGGEVLEERTRWRPGADKALPEAGGAARRQYIIGAYVDFDASRPRSQHYRVWHDAATTSGVKSADDSTTAGHGLAASPGAAIMRLGSDGEGIAGIAGAAVCT